MSLFTRLLNSLRPDRLNRDIDEELESHLAEAVEEGRDPAEARRAFGSPLRQREAARDVRLFGWLHSLHADMIFGWRQLRKNKVTSLAAILSLGLAIGASTAAFRLIDALLLRPLPIADPSNLYVLARQGVDPGGHFRITESTEYPLFERLRTAAKDQADLIAVSFAGRSDLTYGSDEDMEKTWCQYVSASMFDTFGLQPALGRLFNTADDARPHTAPYAILSHDYWTHRFGADPAVIGRTFRLGTDLYEIVGVAPRGFTGTETGVAIDVFLPAMMHPGVTQADSSWLRVFAHLRPGATPEGVRERLLAPFQSFQEERVRTFFGAPQRIVNAYLHQKLLVEPAASGISEMQKDYRRALLALGVLVALVLLIACANIANLMTAQGASRAREMALRVSIGAGRARLVQLVLVESALLAFLSAALGAAFAWWSAPYVLGRIQPPDNPARLALPVDWRLLLFSLALTLTVTALFGLAPALRASTIQPVSALRGGSDPHTRRRVMHALIAAQVAFCFVVLFAAGLFVATFDRLSRQPTGFSAERLLAVEAVSPGLRPAVLWRQVSDGLRGVPGVEDVALAGWPLLSGSEQNGFVSINGAPVVNVLVHFLSVSPGWRETMRIPLLDGRDFRAEDAAPDVALVNETFARTYFNGANPIGKSFDFRRGRVRIVGWVRDARYSNLRDPMAPIVYFPFSASLRAATFLVRTSSVNPLALASLLRREVPRARPEFRVSNIRTQQEIDDRHTLRERLLATLARFFAFVALLLGAIGLYGVLDYSVLQRRRELGIRLAIGAPARDIAQRVTIAVFSMVCIGSLTGLALALAAARYLEPLLYQVKPTGSDRLLLPLTVILIAATLAALPAVLRALRIDPVSMLRSE